MSRKRWIDRLESCATHRLSPRTAEGLSEFVAYENGGPKPQTAYGLDLLACKKWMEWFLNFIADQFGTPEWPGWFMLAHDCRNDPKWFRMIVDRVCQRFPSLPRPDFAALVEEWALPPQ